MLVLLHSALVLTGDLYSVVPCHYVPSKAIRPAAVRGAEHQPAKSTSAAAATPHRWARECVRTRMHARVRVVSMPAHARAHACVCACVWVCLPACGYERGHVEGACAHAFVRGWANAFATPDRAMEALRRFYAILKVCRARRTLDVCSRRRRKPLSRACRPQEYHLTATARVRACARA